MKKQGTYVLCRFSISCHNWFPLLVQPHLKMTPDKHELLFAVIVGLFLTSFYLFFYCAPVFKVNFEPHFGKSDPTDFLAFCMHTLGKTRDLFCSRQLHCRPFFPFGKMGSHSLENAPCETINDQPLTHKIFPSWLLHNPIFFYILQLCVACHDL